MVDSSNIFRVMYNLNSDRLYSCETIGELGICGIDWSTPEVFDFSISPDFLKTSSHITHIRHNHVSDNFSSNELLYLGGLFGEDHIIFNDSLWQAERIWCLSSRWWCCGNNLLLDSRIPKLIINFKQHHILTIVIIRILTI